MFNKYFQHKSNQLLLLDYVSNLYPDIDLSNTLVIACQHLLGTTYNLFEKLFAKGLKPENTYLIGKCYSTNKETFQKFVGSGVKISSLSYEYDSHISFDEQFQRYIEKFLLEIKANTNINNYENVIVLDDGGNLILFADDFFKDLTNISGVEQTSSGYEKLKDASLSFPVVNIARSRAKLEYESPMVAELIAGKIKEYIKTNNIIDPKILIIGQGYIGKGIAELLKHDFAVNGCDSMAEKCDFKSDYQLRLNEFDIIIGAVGTTIISPGDFDNLKDGVILISASSSDREFSAAYLRRLEPITNDCHKDYSIKNIRLLNSGFPINFDGSEHSLKPEKIQLTRALLFAGVLESIKIKNKTGLQEFDNNIQNQIIDKFTSLNV